MHYTITPENYFQYHGDEVCTKLKTLVEAYNYADEAPTMTSVDALYHAEQEIADAAYEIFVDAYDRSYDMVNGLSNGELGEDYIEYMAKVEHELMAMAHKIRQKRLDAVNKNLKGDNYDI